MLTDFFLVSELVLHRKPCICDNLLMCPMQENRKIAQMRRVFFEELVSDVSNTARQTDVDHIPHYCMLYLSVNHKTN